MNTPRKLPPDILGRFRALSTSSLSDGLDRHGLPGAVQGLKPISPGQRMAGQAVTLQYLPVGVSGGTVGDFLHLAESGDVIVIDNRGRTDCTVWGNILTECAQRQGLAGTIIDGVNRDIEESREAGYPIWSRAPHMLTGKDRVMLQGVNVPVAIGTVRVEPGDVVVGDDSGIVVIPCPHAEDVLAAAEEIESREEKIVEAVRAGTELGKARRQFGYFGLQARPEKTS